MANATNKATEKIQEAMKIDPRYNPELDIALGIEPKKPSAQPEQTAKQEQQSKLDDAQKEAFINHFQLNIDDKKGWYANISVFDPKKLEERLKTWNKYVAMNDADKTEVKRLIRNKSAKLIDLFNMFYRKVSRETE